MRLCSIQSQAELLWVVVVGATSGCSMHSLRRMRPVQLFKHEHLVPRI